jgi:hypothetical protein
LPFVPRARLTPKRCGGLPAVFLCGLVVPTVCLGPQGWAKKGMSLVHPSMAPKAYWEFVSEIVILHHQTTMARGYSPVMHIGVVTQSAKIVDIKSLTGENMDALRTGDRALVKCRFMYRPEYIAPGSVLLFREGRAKGVGRVVSVGTDISVSSACGASTIPPASTTTPSAAVPTV